ncbi:MAG: helix-turn-helix transcriptional regulator [Clostridia bacterium]|nr:helix-turn-helix transcriptional regulator [Clostridia bacterium]
MSYDNKITGRVIKALRQKKELTQDVLSGLAGIGRSHLAMIESGDKNANVDTLWRIADALGLSLSELFAMVEDDADKSTSRKQ